MSRLSTRLDRRDVLTMIGAGVLAPLTTWGDERPFQITGIDHVTITVADPARSLAFYTRLFGNAVLKDKDGCHYVKVGSAYVGLTPQKRGKQPAGGNQIGPGIQSFDLPAVESSLQRAAIPYRQTKGQGLLVADSDGILTQFWAENSWNELQKIGQPVSVAAKQEPLIQATSINHLLLAVNDPERAALFYSKIFGPIAQRTPPRPPLSGRIWYQAGTHRIGLAPLNQGYNTSGQRPGIDHFGVIAPFERESLIKGLTEAGAKVLPQGEGPEAAGVDFQDPDGVRLQVMPPPAPRQKKA
jgi:catechol 2,3-dioxygenase-like lactoylglutathione lyase family enzyme